MLLLAASAALAPTSSDLDFIKDDDDLAVLFTLSDGKKVWALGNVEAVAVARGDVDKERATGGRAKSYLQSLDADERPLKGASVHDKKAIFLLRWYQEAKADGTIIKGPRGAPVYQHKECKAYNLPLDNGGYGFEWTSNYAVITKVKLNPSKTKNRLFTMPAPDKKTVVDAAKKMG